ncbi:hypothetical protein HELRODRAFT_183927 [Helobdella robusta]|uniref:Uncharacterized protein n=1 Tax=Helobdella robusta TaxID=6412 RepID=T1FKB1_HELRO|nr:hypothetical protein HELRODRAFT_183927 [Helobdella robusta]ESO09710.1 hypothetical protein HELRODRAFT_183927 [Helobdella robusta]
MHFSPLNETAQRLFATGDSAKNSFGDFSADNTNINHFNFSNTADNLQDCSFGRCDEAAKDLSSSFTRKNFVESAYCSSESDHRESHILSSLHNLTNNFEENCPGSNSFMLLNSKTDVQENSSLTDNILMHANELASEQSHITVLKNNSIFDNLKNKNSTFDNECFESIMSSNTEINFQTNSFEPWRSLDLPHDSTSQLNFHTDQIDCSFSSTSLKNQPLPKDLGDISCIDFKEINMDLDHHNSKPNHDLTDFNSQTSQVSLFEVSKLLQNNTDLNIPEDFSKFPNNFFDSSWLQSSNYTNSYNNSNNMCNYIQGLYMDSDNAFMSSELNGADFTGVANNNNNNNQQQQQQQTQPHQQPQLMTPNYSSVDNLQMSQVNFNNENLDKQNNSLMMSENDSNLKVQKLKSLEDSSTYVNSEYQQETYQATSFLSSICYKDDRQEDGELDESKTFHSLETSRQANMSAQATLMASYHNNMNSYDFSDSVKKPCDISDDENSQFMPDDYSDSGKFGTSFNYGQEYYFKNYMNGDENFLKSKGRGKCIKKVKHRAGRPPGRSYSRSDQFSYAEYQMPNPLEHQTHLQVHHQQEQPLQSVQTVQPVQKPLQQFHHQSFSLQQQFNQKQFNSQHQQQQQQKQQHQQSFPSYIETIKLNAPVSNIEKHGNIWNDKKNLSFINKISLNERVGKFFPKISASSNKHRTQFIFDTSKRPSSVNEAICKYMDYLILENECKTCISSCSTGVQLPYVGFEKERYFHEVMCQPISFPTAKFREWLKLFDMDIEITDIDGLTASQTTFLPPMSQNNYLMPANNVDLSNTSLNSLTNKFKDELSQSPPSSDMAIRSRGRPRKSWSGFSRYSDRDKNNSCSVSPHLSFQNNSFMSSNCWSVNDDPYGVNSSLLNSNGSNGYLHGVHGNLSILDNNSMINPNIFHTSLMKNQSNGSSLINNFRMTSNNGLDQKIFWPPGQAHNSSIQVVKKDVNKNVIIKVITPPKLQYKLNFEKLNSVKIEKNSGTSNLSKVKFTEIGPTQKELHCEKVDENSSADVLAADVHCSSKEEENLKKNCSDQFQQSANDTKEAKFETTCRSKQSNGEVTIVSNSTSSDNLSLECDTIIEPNSINEHSMSRNKMLKGTNSHRRMKHVAKIFTPNLRDESLTEVKTEDDFELSPQPPTLKRKSSKLKEVHITSSLFSLEDGGTVLKKVKPFK